METHIERNWLEMKDPFPLKTFFIIQITYFSKNQAGKVAVVSKAVERQPSHRKKYLEIPTTIPGKSVFDTSSDSMLNAYFIGYE